MPRSARHLLAISLVALNASVMLCGPCLHALPGWGHEAGLSHEAVGDPVRDPVGPAHPGSDHCPVCHFLAQAQITIDPICLSASWDVGALRPEPPTASYRATPHLSSSPRAPPCPSRDRV